MSEAEAKGKESPSCYLQPLWQPEQNQEENQSGHLSDHSLKPGPQVSCVCLHARRWARAEGPRKTVWGVGAGRWGSWATWQK